MANPVDAFGGRKVTIVDVSDNSTDVSTTPSRLYGVVVNTALSAHALPFENGAGGTTQFSIAASAAAGTRVEAWGMPFSAGITVNPNDAATGSIAVVWGPEPDSY